ncbi:MAG: hypothetical protein JRE40_14060, partial [Deltaproteobacteria bacterium]|nr:hypothetical protein [Deltaproteobacteria bacterium]
MTDIANWTEISTVDFTAAATTGDVGLAGGVPKPADDEQNQFLRGDATFEVAIPVWVTATIYEIGDIVYDALTSRVYAKAATGAGVASLGTFILDNAVGRWTELAAEDFTAAATTGDVGLAGAVPKPSDDEQNQYLRGDATFETSVPAWVTATIYEIGDVVYDAITDRVYRKDATGAGVASLGTFILDDAVGRWVQIANAVMVAADDTVSAGDTGLSGAVPKPTDGEQNQYLRGDGTFRVALPGWVTATIYEIGDEVWDGLTGRLYQKGPTGAGVASLGTFILDDTAANSWVEFGNGAMVAAATTGDVGLAGAAPKPGDDEQNQFLRGDATYEVAVPAWATATIYEIGDVVYDALTDRVYRKDATGAGVASLATFILDDAGGRWVQIANAVMVSADNTVSAGDTGLSGAVPKPTDGEQNQYLRGDGTFRVALPAWVTATIYELGDEVWDILTGTLYQKGPTGAGVASLGTFILDNTAANSWVAFGTGDMIAAATTGDVGISGGVPKPADDDQNKYLRGDATFETSIPAWVTATIYEIGDVVYNSGTDKVYRKLTTGAGVASLGTFDLDTAAAGRWDEISRNVVYPWNTATRYKAYDLVK